MREAFMTPAQKILLEAADKEIRKLRMKIQMIKAENQQLLFWLEQKDQMIDELNRIIEQEIDEKDDLRNKMDMLVIDNNDKTLTIKDLCKERKENDLYIAELLRRMRDF